MDKKSFGYRRTASVNDYETAKDLLKLLVRIVSGNGKSVCFILNCCTFLMISGNLLLNIGPTKEGTITPIFQDRLFAMGKWLEINGEAIYGTHPWVIRNDGNKDVWYTSKEDAVYAITVEWPKHDKLILESASDLFLNKSLNVDLLGESKKLKVQVH